MENDILQEVNIYLIFFEFLFKYSQVKGHHKVKIQSLKHDKILEWVKVSVFSL